MRPLPDRSKVTSESGLVDGFGRVVRDLRISVTDRCNFRCRYCMPEEGMEWLPRDELLTYEELTRFVGISLRLGVETVRITGGEPTVRADLPVFVRQLSGLAPDLDIAMTTNGLSLPIIADDLAAAGLKRINVSLDSLRRRTFEEITRRDRLDQVLAGLEAAARAGLHPIKVNCVLLRGVNDDEIEDLAEFGRTNRYQVRFIEFMPLDEGDEWTPDTVVPSSEVLERLDNAFGLVADETKGPEPATTFSYSDGMGSVGVIASVTAPFCSTCDRIRLTADGQLRTCLFATDEANVKELMRSGGSDEAVAALVARAVSNKAAGHLIGLPGFVKPERSMSRIGG